MALKALMLRKAMSDKTVALESLRAKDADFEKREAELEAAIMEASSDEERAVCEEGVDTFQSEKEQHETAKAKLEAELRDLEAELEAVERSAVPPAVKQEAEVSEKIEERKDVSINMRKRFFGLNAEERSAFFANAEVKEWLQRCRQISAEKRAIYGSELLIPVVVLDLMREQLGDYSKLYKHVRVEKIRGYARQPIMNAIPEAVWQEACATLNELELSISGAELDGYKVGGYVVICNAVLMDSDIDLAAVIIDGLLRAIGLALDKAILYGTGVKMPLGILTRLAQSSAPVDYPVIAPTWVDLHSSNVLALNADPSDPLGTFTAIAWAASVAKGGYSNGRTFWAMNGTTYSMLLGLSANFNAAGAIVAGMNKELPIVGGAIEVLDFIPDNVIIGGYGDCYVLAERQGSYISRSEHVRFIEDQTVFKGVARYDGTPILAANAFVAFSLDATAPDPDDVVFAPDTANTAPEPEPDPDDPDTPGY